jgi:CheY-like chemotaxis protein
MTQHSGNQAILIVDDSPFSRALIVAAAEDCACSYEQAENGREALEKVKARKFSLIFMDMLMPGLDGFETVRQMRELGVAAPIIALSALCMKQDKERALELGCNAFVPKPVDLAKLRAIIAEHLSQQPGRVLSPHVVFPTIARPLFDFSRYRMLLVEEDGKSAEAHKFNRQSRTFL